jgi:hypothetical protein
MDFEKSSLPAWSIKLEEDGNIMCHPHCQQNFDGRHKKKEYI